VADSLLIVFQDFQSVGAGKLFDLLQMIGTGSVGGGELLVAQRDACRRKGPVALQNDRKLDRFVGIGGSNQGGSLKHGALAAGQGNLVSICHE
jgi:hypothetical protein